ncbi:VacJ family lipoprotein [Cribrihabitans sp. XS_ASV171]
MKSASFPLSRTLATLAVVALVAGCATQPPEAAARGEVFDPYENTNRAIHDFNRGVDKALLGPASKGYVSTVPEPMVTSLINFADNLSKPGQAVDFLLQGRPQEAGIAVLRFAVNSVIGIGGLGDPATELEIPAVETDFGETLHVWGFGEGAYLELPLYGPSTTRDAVGVMVNIFTNPVDFAPTRPVDNLGVYAEIIRRFGLRGRYSETVDSILYESADSYAQTRIIFLQNRRFELARGDEDAYLDIYDDPYADTVGDSSLDPYAGIPGDTSLDPYEDPYE